MKIFFSLLFLLSFTNAQTAKHKVNHRYIFKCEEEKARIFLKSENIKAAFLVKGNEALKMTNMGKVKGQNYFYIDVPCKDSIEYFFRIEGVKTFYCSSNGIVENIKDVAPFKATLKYIEKRNEVWYAVFVDRFRNANPYNDPRFNELEVFKLDEKYIGLMKNGDIKYENSTWVDNRPLKWEEELGLGKHFRRYGGDLQGIIEKLDYIKSMGVDVILLSPILYSFSSHKYDVIDHLHISPDYGVIEESYRNLSEEEAERKINELDKDEKDKNKQTNREQKNIGQERDEYLLIKEEHKRRVEGDINDSSFTDSDSLFLSLLKKCHEKEMKVVVEFPLNVGKRHFAFMDVVEKGRNSRFFNWFFFSDLDEELEYSGAGPCIEKNGRIYRTRYFPTKNAKAEDLDEILEWNFNNLKFESINDIIPLLNYENEDVKSYLLASLEKFDFDGILIYHTDRELGICKYLKEALAKKGRNILFISDSKEEKLDYSIDFTLLESIQFSDADELKNALEIAMLRNDIQAMSTYDCERIFSSLASTNMRIRPDLLDKNVVKHVKQALMLFSLNSFIFTYGDELGSWGLSDPECRKPMQWDDLEPFLKEQDTLDKQMEGLELDEVNHLAYYENRANEEIKEFFKTFMQIRRDNIDLFKNGKSSFEVVDNALVCYKKVKNKVAVMILNLSNEAKNISLTMPFSGEGIDSIKKKTYHVKEMKVSLEGLDSTIIIWE